jgi:valyl-tRNA synthetase
LLIPLAGLIDKHAERQRLEREISRHEADVKRTGAKLGNEKFVGRAPEEVVAKERARLEAAQRALTQLREQLERLERI